MGATKSSNKVTKKRNWGFILYPDSAPSDWFEQLEKTGLPCCVSPLHDKDINEGTNEPKKAHHHVILCYSGPTSYNVVKCLTDKLNQPIPQALESVKGAYAYLTHENNPEKAHYDKKDITYINGFDISDFADMSKSELTRLIRDIHQIIIDENIIEYSDLLDFLMYNDDSNELYSVAYSHTILFNSYISSRRHKQGGEHTEIENNGGNR